MRKSLAWTVAIGAMIVLLTGGATGGCGSQDYNHGGPTSTVTPTPKYTEPRGAIAPPPQHGKGIDPRDDDFFNPASPPSGSPSGVVTYEVRAQMYNDAMESIGGISTAFINAVALDPRAIGGVGGSHPGVFPYDQEAVRLPFQFPIFLQPGIVVSVGATFTAFADKGEVLSCWLVAPGTGEIPGTRDSVHAPADHSLISANCFGNIG